MCNKIHDCRYNNMSIYKKLWYIRVMTLDTIIIIVKLIL